MVTPRSQPSRLRALIFTRRVQFTLDLTVMVCGFLLAYLLRFDFSIPAGWIERMAVQLPLVVMFQFSALLLTGVYSFVWRYVGLRELGTFAQAALLSAAPLVVLRLALPLLSARSVLAPGWQGWVAPLSVIVVDTVLTFGGLLGLRVVRRLLWERHERIRRAAQGNGARQPVLLVGAGRAGTLALQEIRDRGDLGLRVVGFVDDDPLKQATVIHGVRVLGTTRQLPELLERLAVRDVVITIAEIPHELMRRIAGLCERAGARMRRMPGLFEILQGKVEISRFREVRVEDLLNRQPVDLTRGRPAGAWTGQRVMVTGAGGSIGAELARQIARLQPARLLLVERAESALFEIHRELAQRWPGLEVAPLVADVGDGSRMAAVFGRERPQAVLHAAAHKHVPILEANPSEAVTNNVLATLTLGEIAGRSGCGRFVLVSTDKAVRPTSVMGASKRLAELVMQRLDHLFPTRYLAVRFGNVLGSAGSVVPIFRQQIAAGGPVTVTHPEMVRYFMTIPEAVQLVLEAGAMGEGGEIFILDMGEPVRILDLAEKMIRLSGLVPGKDIPIVFTGPRPGEKLSEELAEATEGVARTRHPKILVGRLSGPPAVALELGLERLGELARNGDGEKIRVCLGELLPEARLEGGEEPRALARSAAPAPAVGPD